MQHARKLGNTLIVLTLLAAAVHAGEVSFHYGFVGKHRTGGDSLTLIEDGTTLRSDEAFKLNVEYPAAVRFYVLYLSSEGEYALLYSSKGKNEGQQGIRFATLDWMTLDKNLGEEKFTLIASDKRLREFERSLARYQKSSGSSRERFQRRIHIILDKLERGPSSSTGVTLLQRLEKPVIGSVTFRGKKTSALASNALGYKASGERVALAIFTIQHQ